ncbi:sensor domain-containing diguanylate cyclase [Psychrobium sp. 1_MG-2023]|uniref:sensor domain-containing diguanylate cyclase n=1 Tax=Psychrobium sp. 1_MG-2023 TaxID=3062624 RepID=UPI000C32125F|nr:sensor domain-containing diguanylate cyclase [Psychrobium sp. 1_MG-2023]MDP2559697.1 diguanylate cyclase [Psychrobium sp. 1_MG-2023]PKF59528.1 PAS domain S-box protein [Alteromonadales bacterium alter-6D02]
MEHVNGTYIEQLIFESLSKTDDCFGVFDQNDQLIFCNDSLAEMFGTTKVIATGQTFSSLIEHCYLHNVGVIVETTDLDHWLHQAGKKRRTQEYRRFEIDLHDQRWLQVTEQLVADDHIFLFATDITKTKLVEAELTSHSNNLFKLATTDELTGIHNRRHFFCLADIEQKRCQRIGTHSSILMLDLDEFKEINDQFGHAAGDQVLKDFCQTINDQLRPYDIFGRLGGEEFAILLPETDNATALLIAERLRESVEKMTALYGSCQIKVTVSIGLSSYTKGTLDQAMSSADRCLYQAKSSGRNQISLLERTCCSA